MTVSVDALSILIQQTRQNVEFLIAQNKISALDGRDILAKLPTEFADDMLASRAANLSVSPPMPSMPVMPSVTSAYSPAPPSAPVYSPPPQVSSPAKLQQARALWAYNEKGEDANDLAFTAGETIEIVEETNTDWWTGRARGKQGLFPSNYVEKIGHAAPAPPAGLPAPYRNVTPSYPSYQPAYQPPPQGPPPPAQYTPFNGGPVSMQAAPAPVAPEEPKKSKFGKYGNTVSSTYVVASPCS
ncbi:SH3 domain-containing protein [Schizophyllum amplum]|uniref:SH3 domain-containing protein n=1 Tax=Schizophyllum amplum TaxID=97359 RepID=A0A550CJB5_9AGAR|nr:SH3 domain-containing protein [Auriculariopsis ampla]